MESGVVEKAQGQMSLQFRKLQSETTNTPKHLLGQISVIYMDSLVSLYQISNITYKDARELKITPFDKSATTSVKNALDGSGIKSCVQNNILSVNVADLPAFDEQKKQHMEHYVKRINDIFTCALHELQGTSSLLDRPNEERRLRGLLRQYYEKIGLKKDDDDDFLQGSPVRNVVPPSSGTTGAYLPLPPPEDPENDEDASEA